MITLCVHVNGRSDSIETSGRKEKECVKAARLATREVKSKLSLKSELRSVRFWIDRCQLKGNQLSAPAFAGCFRRRKCLRCGRKGKIVSREGIISRKQHLFAFAREDHLPRSRVSSRKREERRACLKRQVQAWLLFGTLRCEMDTFRTNGR